MGSQTGSEIVNTAAIYPGSFDPVTNGHLDIIRRSREVFPRLIVAVLRNPRKDATFPVAARTAMLDRLLADDDRIEVISFDGLLVKVAQERDASVIIRGLRAVTDFEYEFQMAMMNRHLDGQIKTMFMVPHEDYTYLSSSLIKDIYELGGTVTGMVPAEVEEQLREHFTRPKE